MRFFPDAFCMRPVTVFMKMLLPAPGGPSTRVARPGLMTPEVLLMRCTSCRSRGMHVSAVCLTAFVIELIAPAPTSALASMQRLS
eukprot:CAMPEP_0177795180 /NCGR_PEP_ID=MMETSP0491_2-20121128/26086_1 /TAXON_ID=63592 /ORGANISM="Tetraselmis chuii, Strain PLY429" /LENGTH=84 /DNA_ID=CAMNT_0019317975 /DNA_START=213 /DNA_END=467 /DNA_ORIENTATION=-